LFLCLYISLIFFSPLWTRSTGVVWDSMSPRVFFCAPLPPSVPSLPSLFLSWFGNALGFSNWWWILKKLNDPLVRQSVHVDSLCTNLIIQWLDQCRSCRPHIQWCFFFTLVNDLNNETELCQISGVLCLSVGFESQAIQAYGPAGINLWCVEFKNNCSHWVDSLINWLCCSSCWKSQTPPSGGQS